MNCARTTGSMRLMIRRRSGCQATGRILTDAWKITRTLAGLQHTDLQPPAESPKRGLDLADMAAVQRVAKPAYRLH